MTEALERVLRHLGAIQGLLEDKAALELMVSSTLLRERAARDAAEAVEELKRQLDM